MDNAGFFFTVDVDENTQLFLTPLTDDEASSVGLDDDQSGGYFLYEKSVGEPADITILAQVETDEAAFALSRLLNMD